ncbi:MAG: transposase, partial [Candidatus Zixiibacteriota bacterium]
QEGETAITPERHKPGGTFVVVMAESCHRRTSKLPTASCGLPDRATGLTEDLDSIAREGAQRMLLSVLEAEVTEFLGRQRYERTVTRSGYRNGYGKGRRVTLGTGTVRVRAPRVRDSEEPFASQVLPAWQRRSQAVKELIPELYVQGLATGDFELALRGLLGETAIW